MTLVIDPHGVEPRALAELVDFTGLRVLEVGCGDGRLTWTYAERAESVLALDTNDESIAAARAALPAHLAGRVRFEAKSVVDVEELPAAFDLVFFSWSL